MLKLNCQLKSNAKNLSNIGISRYAVIIALRNLLKSTDYFNFPLNIHINQLLVKLLFTTFQCGFTIDFPISARASRDNLPLANNAPLPESKLLYLSFFI